MITGAGKGNEPLRVTMFPDLLTSDPYSDLLDAALERRGIKVQRGRTLDRHWARQALSHGDVVHLHWVEFLFWPGGRSRLHRLVSMWVQAARLISALRLLRASPVKVVWTVHHLSPRESPYPRVHGMVQRAILRCADAIVAHSHYAAARVERIARGVPVHVVPHGGYRGVYPPPREGRDQVRARVGVEGSAFLYLIFGTVRDYKRVPQAIRAFRALRGDDARLLIAGDAPGATRVAVEQAAQGDSRISLELRSIPDEEVAEIFQAADVLILNYSEVFSSGALLLSLAFGLPVIAAAEGSAVELAPPPATVPSDQGELTRALSEARQNRDARRHAALEAAGHASWERTAELLEAVYRGAGAASRGSVPQSDPVSEKIEVEANSR
jgi:beta-1,4-mannosyltransferase